MKRSNTCRGFLTVLALSLLASCGTTPPSQHYILRALATAPEENSGVSLGVGPISVPDYLKRDNFVFSRESNQLDINTTERWAEPLEEGISRVMLLNLAGLLQSQDVRSYPWHPRRKPDFAVEVRLVELDADSQQARLVAEWLLLEPSSDAPLHRRISRFQQPLATMSAGDVAAAYSTLLFQLSQEVATTVEAERDSQPLAE